MVVEMSLLHFKMKYKIKRMLCFPESALIFQVTGCFACVQLALEVAPCKPFSNVLDTVEIVTCSFLVDSMVIMQEMQDNTGNWSRRQDVLNEQWYCLDWVHSLGCARGNCITHLWCSIKVKQAFVPLSEHVLDGSGLQHSFTAPEHHLSGETSQVLPQDGDGGCLRWVSGRACSSPLPFIFRFHSL